MTTNAIRLTSPSELLAIVPYVLGFNPTSSIVVLCLRNSRLGLTQRLDLPQPQDAQQVASALMPSLLKENPDSVIAIGYEHHKGESLPAIEALTAALQSHDVQIHDRIVVRGGRWRSLDCLSSDCCPRQGSRVPEPAEVSGVVVEFVGQGVSPQPDRETLASQLEAGPQAAAVAKAMQSLQKAKAKAHDRWSVARAELFMAWSRILNFDAPVITSEDAAMAAVSLQDIEVRDAVVARLCPGTLNLKELSEEVQKLICGLEQAGGDNYTDRSSTEAQNAIQDALIRLCAMLPDPMAAPALSVLASFTWWRGDGALTRVALDRALRCEPDYRLAQLLLQMVDLAIRPVSR